jgi:hypothetical protein
MKRMVFIIAVFAILVSVAGCTKTSPSVFTWNYAGRHYVADSSYISRGSDNRIASYSQLTALGIDPGGQLAVGSYSFHNNNNSNLPYMFYDYAVTEYSQSGTLTITAVDANKASGSFVVYYTDGTAMSGQFSDIPFR